MTKVQHMHSYMVPLAVDFAAFNEFTMSGIIIFDDSGFCHIPT